MVKILVVGSDNLEHLVEILKNQTEKTLMIANNGFATGTCTCGATGCPEFCNGTALFYDEYAAYDASVWDDLVILEHPTLIYHAIKQHIYINKFRTVFKKINKYYRRMNFSKSGYLPRKIRRIRKSR